MVNKAPGLMTHHFFSLGDSVGLVMEDSTLNDPCVFVGCIHKQLPGKQFSLLWYKQDRQHPPNYNRVFFNSKGTDSQSFDATKENVVAP